MIKVRTVKSTRGLNPDVKFSSFLKKIPQNEKNSNNAIDKIIQPKSSNKDCLNSEKNTGNQIGIDPNIVLKEKFGEFNNEEIKKQECVENQNDVQYYEREISIEEESKLRTALTNHFMFQELNEDIM